MNLTGLANTRKLDVLATLPQELAVTTASAWAEANKPGTTVSAFLEGPTFLQDGRLAMTDIPHGRVLSLGPSGTWEILADYDGEPNGMVLDPSGELVIADYRRGLLRLSVATGAIEQVLPRLNSEGFKGLNDVIRASTGAYFFTDQGQTGLHDPTGRVYRLHEGRVDALIVNGISPNGLVLSPDETVLFVAMTRDNSVWRVPLREQGGVAKAGRFCQLFGTSGPDGLAMTSGGELLVAHASLGSVFRYAPNGELIERLASPTGQTITNVTFDPANPYRLVATESSTNTILTTTLDTPGIA